MSPAYAQALKAARFLKKQWASAPPQVAIILGSGLGEVVECMERSTRIPYARIPHFPRPTAQGHSGTLHAGFWGKSPVAVLEGRSHLYEGYSPEEVALPTRALALAGIEVLILTCAAGGIHPRATPGSFMIFSDHINLLGANPLVGVHDEGLGPRFPDMTVAYDPALRRSALGAAKKLGLRCFEGVYAAVLGPNFETPAEIRALQRLGAGAVGMSTVPEVLAARPLGLRVLAIASISNRAAGLSPAPLTHAEVLAAGKSAAGNLARLIGQIIAGGFTGRANV